MAHMLPPVTFEWLAMLLAFVASMATGFVIYAKPVLGGWWMKQVGIPESGPDKSSAGRAMGIATVMGIVLVVGFTILVDWTGVDDLQGALMLGAGAWLAAGLPIAMVHPTFEGRSPMVGVLYAAHHLVEFLLVAVILVLLG